MQVLKDLSAKVTNDRVLPSDHAEPNLGVVILTCMDARIDVLDLLDIAPGDAHIVRNAGGLATPDAVRSIAMSQRLLGTERILVIQHTDCGIQRVAPNDFEAIIREETGADPQWPAPSASTPEETLALTLSLLREAEEIPHRELIEGAILDLAAIKASQLERSATS
jgi:carbonic anhydrase